MCHTYYALLNIFANVYPGDQKDLYVEGFSVTVISPMAGGSENDW